MTEQSLEESISRIVDDPDFGKILNRRSTFNIFEALGAIQGELKHSNFLAFLLDPSSNHGLGAEPLRKLLRVVLSSMATERRPVSTLEVILRDLDDAIVERERASIDILISIKDLKLVVAIENKVRSKESAGQLDRYQNYVEREYGGWRHLFIYLTPDGQIPNNDKYQSLTYSAIADMVSTLGEEFESPSERIVFSHYVEMLRRHIVSDNELDDLAIQLYNRHKAAFDYIYSLIPKNSQLFDIVRSLRDEAENLVADRDTSTFVRFVPSSWDGRNALKKCPLTEWSRTGRHVLFEIKTYNSEAARDRVNLSLIIGPAPADERLKLWNHARDMNYPGLVKPMGEKWTTIWSRDLISQKAGAGQDIGEKRQIIEAAWGTFLETDLPNLEKQVLEIVGE